MSKNFPPIPDIQNGEEGGVVRDKLNAVIGQTNKQWDHSTKQSNPHNVKAPQVNLEPVLAPLSDNEQNVQDALEFLFNYFSESDGDWHLSHIDGNYVYIEIKHGPDSEFPPTTADLELAELKINHDEGQLWTRLADDTIVKIGDKSFITDSPLDGELYGRKDGDWHRVSLATVSDDMPHDPAEGDLWVDTQNTMELYVYIANSGWVSMTGAGGGSADSLPDNLVSDVVDGTMVNKLLGREIDDQGEGLWRPIYTDDIITRGAQPMFRSTETGRFTKATDPSAIRDQQTANWFLYESMMDMGDVHVGIDPPDDPQDGYMWYDTVRLELFVYAEGAWLPCSPLGARVDAGEILQAEILERVTEGEQVQAQIAEAVDNKLGKNERNLVTPDFRILGTNKTFISTRDNELGLFNLKAPTLGLHATNKDYVDGQIDAKIAAIELPESDVDKAYVDQQDDALDVRITSGEQLQNQILVDLRENTSDISSINILSQQNYGKIAKNSQDIEDLQNQAGADLDGYLPLSGGTASKMTGNLYMGGNFIAGVDEPTANDHVATKRYADEKLAKTGGTLTDSLNINKGNKPGPQLRITPNSGDNYATNIYAMQNGELRLRSSGTDSEGDHVGSHIVIQANDDEPTTKIYHVPEPTQPHMAANKEYVDNQLDSGRAAGLNLDIWKYKGWNYDKTRLSDGEWCFTDFSDYTEIYLAQKNSRGQYYHPTSSNSTSEYTYQITNSGGIGLPMTVMDQSGKNQFFAEPKKFVFNKGNTNYTLIECVKVRKPSAQLTTDAHYMLNVPGLIGPVAGW